MRHLAVFLLLTLVGAGLRAAVCGAGQGGNPGLTRMGGHHFKVTTASPEAQACFDRGLTWAYSFGYYAAEQEFRRAAAMDTNCAMAHWGIALVSGPHINFPMVPPDRAVKAWEAICRAQRAGRQDKPA